MSVPTKRTYQVTQPPLSSQPAAVHAVEPPAGPSPKKTKLGLWDKIGGGPLLFAALFHLILLVIAAFWIFQIIHPPEKTVDFMPPGGGGGERSAESVAMKKMKQITPTNNAKRVFAEGATSNYAIPEQGDTFGDMSALTSLSGGGLSGGLGGSGDGKGFGKGSGLGSGTGGMGVGNPFGLVNPTAKGLVGVLYDAKQSPKHEPNDINPQGMGDLLRDFTDHGWNERNLSRKYFQAPQKLILNQVFMPLMAAGEAPKAFECEKEVQPSRWLILYRGSVTAPKTGKFRFVGASDDTLVVRFNRKDVFDHGFYKGTTGLRRSGRDKPVLYKYPNTPHYNDNIGGFETGAEFDVRAGSTYPIEILISEIPGGYFGAVLLIQETGVDYPKTDTGAPLLPLFRVDDGPAPEAGKNTPPFAPQGPVWKLSASSFQPDI